MNPKLFEEIYASGAWGGGSGGGDDPANMQPYLDYLHGFMDNHHIHSVVDAGCGAWRCMSTIDLDGIEYLGIDCVESVIAQNVDKYTKRNVHFWLANFIKIDLPKADLLICKDVFQHLSNEDILEFLPRLKQFQYCLIVNDLSGNHDRTIDGIDNSYHGLDLSAPPFVLEGRHIMDMGVCGVLKRFFLVHNKPCTSPNL